MKYIDISVPLRNQMPSWPDSVGINITQTKSISEGDVANVTRLNMDVHVGTHIEAPRHFLQYGSTVDRIKLPLLIGEATVAYLPDVSEITAACLESLGLDENVRRLLLKTRNSSLWDNGVIEFQRDYVALTLDGARWIVNKGVQVIGIDYLSIQKYTDDPETHRVLMDAGVIIIEGLNLTAVSPGNYEMLCLPLLIEGAEGAPARVVLRTSTGNVE